MFAVADARCGPTGARSTSMRTRVKLRIAVEEMLGEPEAERLGLADRLSRGQRIHRVLHRVGRQHVAVVAVGIGLVVVPFEADRDRQVAQVVTIAAARDLDEPDSAICRTQIERA